jgi:uncharacterized protein YbcI
MHGVSASTGAREDEDLSGAPSGHPVRPAPTPGLADETAQSTSGGELNAHLARAIVRVYREGTGRGPTKAQAFFRGNVLVVLLEDVLTRVERTLVAAGREDAVRRARDELQRAMAPGLIAAAEHVTSCGVTALMSDLHLAPELVSHVFVLDRGVLRSVPATLEHSQRTQLARDEWARANGRGPHSR